MSPGKQRTAPIAAPIAVMIAGVAWLSACPAPPEPAGSDGDTDSDSDGDTGPNLPPPAPTLLSPGDGAVDVPTSSELCWNPVADPEGAAVGYRVWIDEVELANGKLGGYGFDSTCTGPLDFLDDRSFSWRVRAFEIDAPERESADSESWSFTTAWESGAKPIFVDDFSEDRGWTVSGAALSGAWVRAVPEPVYDLDSAVAQPGACFTGDGCFFTGHNPGGTLGEADVDGGAVVLTSPAFDPGPATSVSVSLARFFYRSSFEVSGLSLEVALVVPDEVGDGVTVHVLEKLDGGPLIEAAPANSWTAVAYAACGVTLRAGTRLRITASDLLVPEAAVVEAAIDEVRIEGYPDQDICAPGPGALCDPDDPEPACGPDLLCCAQGPVYAGIHRCIEAVAAIGDDPPDQPGGALTGPLGCDAPDLTVLDDDLAVYMQNIWVAPDSCTLYEGCVGGTGWRRVLRFDTKTANVGARDLVMGVPANHPDLYTFSPCHGHHHFDDYAVYGLYGGQEGQELLASGHKQAFCLLDWSSWAWPALVQEDGTFTCYNQGLSLGWSDTYAASLDCQWIDVTDLEPGAYTLRMAVNLPPPGKAHATLVERRYDNNVLEIPVVVD